MKISLILPCINEIRGLKVYLPELIEKNYHQIVLLDGGSTDGSIEYAEAMGCIIQKQSRKGMRAAYLEFYDKWTGEGIVTFSPDGNSLVSAISSITSKLEEGYEMVIASRYKDGARSYDDTFLTGLANGAFTRLISLFGYHYTDAMVMLRGYHRDVPERLGLTVLRSENYENGIGKQMSWEPLMSIRAAKARMRITEVPADEPVRVDTTGQNLFLPATRISHFTMGINYSLQLVEELLWWKWPVRHQTRLN